MSLHIENLTENLTSESYIFFMCLSCEKARQKDVDLFGSIISVVGKSPVTEIIASFLSTQKSYKSYKALCSGLTKSHLF